MRIGKKFQKSRLLKILPVNYQRGTGSFPGLKQPGRGTNHPPHLKPKLKKE